MYLSTSRRRRFFAARLWTTATGCRCGLSGWARGSPAGDLPRRPGDRAGRRAARGGRRAPRAGVRARGRGHRQDPHHHPADRAPGPRRPRRPRPGPRGHLHRPRGGGDAHPAARARRRRRAGPHVPRRRAAPAALLLAAGGRRASSGSCWRASCGSSAQAAARAPAGTDAASLRDLAGEIEWAKASLVAPGRLPGGGRPRLHRDTPGPAEQVAAVYAGYEELKNRAELLDFDDLLLHTAAALEEHRGVAERVPRPLPLLRRRRVPGRHAAAAARARRLARRAGRPHRGRRRQPDDLLLRRGRPAVPARLPAPVPRGRRSSGWTRDYRSTPQVVVRGEHGDRRRARRGSPARGCSSSGSCRRGRTPRSTSTTTSPPRPRRSPQRDPRAGRRRHAGRRDRRAVPGERPVRGLRAGAHRRRACPTRCAAASGSSPAPEVRQAMTALRGAAARAGRRAAAATPSAPSSTRLGLTAEPPPAAPRASAWESLLALVELAEELVAVEPSADLRRFVAELDSARRGAAPADGAGRHARLAARGQGPGVGRGVPGRPGRRDAADPARRRRRRRDRGGAPAALRRRHPGAAAAVAVVGAVAPARRAAGAGGAAGSCTGSCRTSTRPPRVPTGGRGAGGAKPRCRVCGKPLLGPMRRSCGRCDDCPSDVDEELLDRLQGLARSTAKEQQVPAYVVFTDATLTAIAEQRPADTRRWWRSPGSARTSSTATARPCSRNGGRRGDDLARDPVLPGGR